MNSINKYIDLETNSTDKLCGKLTRLFYFHKFAFMDIKTNKIINSIQFFSNKSKDNTVNRLKLMKLLWLPDRVHLNKYGLSILKDNYKALPHSPVPSNTMDFSKNSISENFHVKGYNITSEKEFDPKYFSTSDLEVMNFIWNKFGFLNQFELRDISHKFPEWLRFEKELNDEYSPKSYDMIMEDFFIHPNIEDYKDVFSIEGVEDSLSHFRSHNAIQSNLDT